MTHEVKYFASYSRYGVSTTYNSVGRTLEVFFDRDQRNLWVKADPERLSMPKRQAINLRQACTILSKSSSYTVHERDGSAYVIQACDVVQQSLADSLLTLKSRCFEKTLV